MSVVVHTPLIQRVEQIRAVAAADYRESKHHHGQGRRPAFVAGCLDILTRLLGKLHRNAAVAIFPLDPHALNRMWPDLPEHLIRRAITVFQTLGLIIRVSKLARRTSRSKSPTPGATAAWYAPSQYRFTDRVLALLGLPTSPLENLTDEEEPANVKELEEGGFSNSFKTMSSGVLAGYGLTEAELACLSETERRTLASYAEEEAQGIAEDREKGWTFWAKSTPARILADLRYKARTWAAEGAEFRRGVRDLKRLAAGYEPPKMDYRIISKAQVTHQSFRPANVGKIPSHMTAEDRTLDQARRIMDGRLDPLTVWGLIPGMGEDEARAIHKRDARMTAEDIIRRRLKRADVDDSDYH